MPPSTSYRRGHRLRGRWPVGWRVNREATGFSRVELSLLCDPHVVDRRLDQARAAGIGGFDLDANGLPGVAAYVDRGGRPGRVVVVGRAQFLEHLRGGGRADDFDAQVI